MTDLETLVNIGAKLAADLRAVDIPDVETLRVVGAAEAAQRLAAAGLRDCAHARRALDGALAGRRWAGPGQTVGTPPADVLGIDNVLVAVGDLDEAIRFYTRVAGLRLRFRLDARRLALFQIGEEEPGLLVREHHAAVGGPSTDHAPRLWLEVPDARRLAADLPARGAVPLQPPFQVATGWAVEVGDPWGNVIGFTDYSAAPARGRARRTAGGADG
jgi:predicted enzyme related to lactoylglutathione lyase